MDMNEVIAEVEYTMQDINDYFEREFGREPSEKELEALRDNLNFKGLRNAIEEEGSIFFRTLMGMDAQTIIDEVKQNEFDEKLEKIKKDFSKKYPEIVNDKTVSDIGEAIREDNDGIDGTPLLEEIAYRLIEMTHDMHGFDGSVEERGGEPVFEQSSVMEASSGILEKAATAYIAGEKEIDQIQDFINESLKADEMFQEYEKRGILTDFAQKNQPLEIFSFSPFGYEGAMVRVETDLRRGIPAYDIVGLSDGTIMESRQRIKTAIKNSSLDFPDERILQSLSPADLKKEGASFDLPMALSIMAAQKQLQGGQVLVMGELELSGETRPVRAVHAAVATAKAMGVRNVIVPEKNAAEAMAVDGVKVIGVKNLSEAVQFLEQEKPFPENTREKAAPTNEVEFNDELLRLASENLNLDGQYNAARAIEIAVAGKHNILLTGAPGNGKTLMMQYLIPALTPAMTNEEAASATRIHSIAGLTSKDNPKMKFPAFRQPHMSASLEGICGGGINCRPGEASLAHNGTLFLDEAAEFRSSVLQMLRVPLESKTITLSRAGRSTVFPANFQLAMATNPCPCGNAGSESKICLCSEKAIDLYWKKFSAPLIDRVEIKQWVEPDPTDARKITVAEMKKGVETAIKIQREKGSCNSRLDPAEVQRLRDGLNVECREFCNSRAEREDLSPRATDQMLKVALTIANIDGRNEIAIDDLREANELITPIFDKPNEYKRGELSEKPEQSKPVEEVKMTEIVLDFKNGTSYTRPYKAPDVPANVEKVFEEPEQPKQESKKQKRHSGGMGY